MAFTDNSRCLLTSIVALKNSAGELVKPPFLDLRARITEYDPSDRIVKAKQSDDWANVGLDQLTDARHWWVIADLSNIVDPFNELETGTTLRSPSLSRFLFKIVSGERGSAS